MHVELVMSLHQNALVLRCFGQYGGHWYVLFMISQGGHIYYYVARVREAYQGTTCMYWR